MILVVFILIVIIFRTKTVILKNILNLTQLVTSIITLGRLAWKNAAFGLGKETGQKSHRQGYKARKGLCKAFPIL